MSISFRKYVDIISGVGGGAVVRNRDLIGRLFTSNWRLPVGVLAEVDNADDVAALFGTASEEYARAVFYFSWISPLITRARRLSFARWVPEASPPRIIGQNSAKNLGSFTAVTAGTFNILLDGAVTAVGPINLSTATSLADVASLVRTAVRATAPAQLATANVVYEVGTRRFVLTGATATPVVISVTAGTSNDLAGLLGWLPSQAMYSDGALAQSISSSLIDSSQASNNFGSFLFMGALTTTQAIEAAQWTDNENVRYQFMVRATRDQVNELALALLPYSGTAVTLTTSATEYDEMVPMIQLAATDYTKPNAVTVYMFKQFALTPKVLTTTESNTLDTLRINYYGRTQTAGQLLAFYQRGILMGSSTAPVDMNVHGNEQWLKDDVGAGIMSLLMSVGQVSANVEGIGQVTGVLQQSVDRALRNGVISVGKTLNAVQRAYVTELSDDALAWRQVENKGYWLRVTIQEFATTDGRTEYKAVYLLIYGKADAIRKVEGTHSLI